VSATDLEAAWKAAQADEYVKSEAATEAWKVYCARDNEWKTAHRATEAALDALKVALGGSCASH
jgi:hypothetical protein